MTNIKWLIFASLTLILCLECVPVYGANILAFMPAFTTSHLVVEMAVVKGMAERNHNVTVVSTLPLKSEWLHPNMVHIQSETHPYDMNNVVSATNKAKGVKAFLQYISMLDDVNRELSHIMDDPKLQELLNNRGNNYDLMILGYIYGDFFFGLAEHFNCPLALVWPNIAMTSHLQLIGNPLEMTYTTLSIYNKVTNNIGFAFRLKNVLIVVMEEWMLARQFNFAKTIYEKHFPADKYVSFEKAKERVAMVLFSHHFTEKPVRPLVPGLIEIGGIHLNEEPKPLPKDIENFVNSAEDGFIFFSLGTNVKVSHLQDGALEKIYNVLSKLPQKVLWKCDDESNVPGNSSNILFRNWLPQGDILGHPNVKLFFGHGGKGGITEAKFYGVPMVGLPVFADQPMNMEEVVSKGYGLSISHDEPITEEIIYKTVKEVLDNETYSRNVKKFSNLYRDRPLKIKDNAVYWLEYLIRYNGAPHLQSPLKTMSFVEKTNLDVILFIMLVLFFAAIVLKYSIRCIVKILFRLLRGKTKND